MWASDVVLSHSDVAPAGRSDVMCSFSRAKRTSLGEADITHEVHITFRASGTHRSKNEKSSPFGLLSFLVAEVGFEPHGLRVMSPTSYQAALLRDIKKYGAGNGNRTRTMLSHHGILSPGRLPIPPLRRIVYEDLSFDAHILYHFIFNMSIYF